MHRNFKGIEKTVYAYPIIPGNESVITNSNL